MDTLANLTRRCGCTVSTAGSYIKVNNGLLDQHGKLVPATPLIFSKVRLNCDYDPLAYNAYVDKFLNQLFVDKGDVEQRMIFEEFLGTILFDKNDLAKTALVLCGGHMKIGSACKSKLTDTLKRFLGTDNYQSVPITALTPGNNKDLCAVASCICNFDDDTFEGKLNKGTAGICKKLIGSSDDFNIKPLYGESIKAKIKLKFFCTANEFPESELFEKPLFDRFVILGCYNKFPSIYNEVPDNDIVAACTDQQGLSYLLKLAMNG
jgi:phage/plasmid-associated DNA primase